MVKKYCGHWTPDTCGCRIRQEQDTETGKITFIPELLCSIHKGCTGDQVANENKMKNNTIQIIQKKVEGAKVINYKWSFDPQRNLEIDYETIEGLTDQNVALLKLSGLDLENVTDIDTGKKELIKQAFPEAVISKPKSEDLAKIQSETALLYGAGLVKVKEA